MMTVASTTTSPYPTALTTPREVPRAGPSRSGLPNRKPQDQQHKTRKTPPRPVPIVNQPGYIRECDGHRHICVELVVPVEAVGDKLKGRENFYISQLGLVYLILFSKNPSRISCRIPLMKSPIASEA